MALGVALLAVLALLAAEISLALASNLPAPLERAVPCQTDDGPASPAAQDENGAPAQDGANAPCPLMQGPLCLNLCAAALPALALTAPAVLHRSDMSFEAATLTPHAISPPRRPPKPL